MCVLHRKVSYHLNVTLTKATLLSVCNQTETKTHSHARELSHRLKKKIHLLGNQGRRTHMQISWDVEETMKMRLRMAE